MNKTLSDALRSLERAKESAQERLAELEQERAEIKESLQSVDAALKAFEKKASKASRQGRGAVTTHEVIEIATRILRESGDTPKATLVAQIGKDVVAQGKSRAGLALRLKQAFQDPRFVQGKQGVRLSDSAD